MFNSDKLFLLHSIYLETAYYPQVIVFLTWKLRDKHFKTGGSTNVHLVIVAGIHRFQDWLSVLQWFQSHVHWFMEISVKSLARRRPVTHIESIGKRNDGNNITRPQKTFIIFGPNSKTWKNKTQTTNHHPTVPSKSFTHHYLFRSFPGANFGHLGSFRPWRFSFDHLSGSSHRRLRIAP